MGAPATVAESPATGADGEQQADSALLIQVLAESSAAAQLPSAADRPRSPAWLRSGPVLPAWAGWSVIVGTVGAAVALLVWIAPAVPSLDLATLLLLVAFIALAEVLGLELFGEGGGSSYSISAVPTLAAGMLLGVPGAVVVAPASALLRGIRRRSRWYKVLFNASAYLLAAGLAAATYQRFGQPLAPSLLPVLLLAAATAGLTYYLHTVVVAAAMTTQLRVPVLQVWSERFRWLWPQYVVLGCMGLFLALAYQAFGVAGAAAFVVPPLMMRYVAKQHIDRTLEHVRQLRALNEQLATLAVENARLYGEAQAALRVRDEFLSVAAHELNTPVAGVRGFAQLLLRQYAQADVLESARVRHALQAIDRQSDRLARLVSHLLDVSRLEAGKLALELKVTDLTRLVEEVADDAQTRTATHALRVAVPGQVLAVVDPLRLEQVLTNLVDNAIKYSPRGGTIDLELSTPDSDTLQLAVRDRGVGIPPESQPRIFDRFYQADPVLQHSSGMGLGLYISHQIVELHGGRIEVEAPPDGGTRVIVRLPVNPDDPSFRAGGGSRGAGT
jgi:signal transduction histidine kinase